MKKLLVLLTIVMLVFAGGVVAAQDAPAAPAEAVVSRLESYLTNLPQGYGVTRVADLLTLLAEQELVLLDVREVEEYEAGHLEESFNVPIRTLTQNLNLLPDTSATIVVICKGGARASLAAAALQVLGYENVKILAGGFDAWAGEELPSTTEAFVPEAGEAPEFDAEVFAAVDAYLTNLPQGFGLVGSKDLSAELIDNPPFLLDVRSPEEYGKAYIEGTTHIWIEELWDRIDELPEDKATPIVVYCASGYRGGIAAVALELLGYENVRNLSGGLNGWVAAELPVVKAFDLTTTLTDYVASLPDTFGALRTADFKAELEGDAELTIVDVRTADEYTEGHVAGAFNIPLNELTDHLNLLPNLDANIVIYCGSGHRSAIAMSALQMLGYTNVRSVLSGANSFEAAEIALVTEPVTVEEGTAPEIEPNLFAAVDTYIKSIPQGYWVVRAPDLNVELAENAPAIIDVRTAGEWDNGRIEGATHFPLRDFMVDLTALPADKTAPIVVYDNPTHRSSIALTLLKMLGYENVRVLGGGSGAWTTAGFELVK